MALARFNERLHHVLGRLGRAHMRASDHQGEAGLEHDEKEPKITGLVGPADPDVVQPRPGDSTTGIARYVGPEGDRRDGGSVAVEG